MSLLLPPAALAARRGAVAGALAPLADSLAAELAPWLGREPFVPLEKARMSRAGGRCAVDGATLEFDPRAPRAHRCPVCGRVHEDEAHYRSWIMWYQLWLAERAVHAAALHLLRGEPGAAPFADEVLARHAELYLRYPNRDNVLGPTRPFFSTYLESIWLLQLAVALDLREAAGDVSAALGAAVRERVVAPSAALIGAYDEGGSNRQVWNAAALLAAARLLGDDAGAERAVHGPSGLVSQLAGGLLADGTWYEGDNYHQFAHRGLWYGVALAEAAGIALPAPLVTRFEAGFAAPFVSALPDLTFPSRRDSQYAVSLRQWRFAEMAELGLARRDDARLVGALHELYDGGGGVPRGDTGRWRSAAESERNAPPSSLGRADLGWRSLLFARETLPPLEPAARGSVLLEGQGLAILRRDGGRLYAALDYGQSGGGHGHPDRLGLLLSDGATRWLDDPGTGSYVDRSLHWYRSTLAHSAPLVDGRSQQRVSGELRAFEERGGAGWVDAEAGIAPGVVARRAVVVMPDYLVDELTWSAEREVVLDLPVHADGELEGVGAWERAALEGGRGLEDGFEFVSDAERAGCRAAAATLRARAPGSGTARADVWIAVDRVAGVGAEWWRARAPGPPGAGDRRLHLVRVAGARGRVASVWSWRGAVRAARRDPLGALVVELTDGQSHEHRREADGWQVRLWGGGAASSVDLGGARALPDRAPGAPAVAAEAMPLAIIPRVDGLAPLGAAPPASALVVTMGEREYRRSEESWREAGAPTAEVALVACGDELVVEVRVPRSALLFVPAGAGNEMDNEHAEVNGDGVQLHLASIDGGTVAAWRVVPEWPEGQVRVSPVAGLDPVAGSRPRAEWRRWRAGYLVRCAVPLATVGDAAPAALRLDVIVNETAPGRERRRGQLVLGGAGGEFVYLRGDRQPVGRLVPFSIAPAVPPAHV